MNEKYRESGVNIDEGNKFVKSISSLIKTTHKRGVISDLKGFAAHFALDLSDIKEPVLVSGTDGVGTKLKIALDMNKFDTIGIDLVAMCINDIACSGAKPLFFLDYFATSKLDANKHRDIIAGIVDGCKQAECALVGGETAEMPGMYLGDDFDLAGFAVGIADRSKIIDGSMIGGSDAIIGIASSGVHSNGFSLVRHIIEKNNLSLTQKYEPLKATLGETLLAPTKIYTRAVLHLIRDFDVKGIAHITGGGFHENIPRILPTSVKATIYKDSFEVQPIFRLLQQYGNISEEELFRVFNCGIGMIFIVPEKQAEEIVQIVNTDGHDAWIIGKTGIRKNGEPPIVLE